MYLLQVGRLKFLLRAASLIDKEQAWLNEGFLPWEVEKVCVMCAVTMLSAHTEGLWPVKHSPFMGNWKSTPSGLPTKLKHNATSIPSRVGSEAVRSYRTVYKNKTDQRSPSFDIPTHNRRGIYKPKTCTWGIVEGQGIMNINWRKRDAKRRYTSLASSAETLTLGKVCGDN